MAMARALCVSLVLLVGLNLYIQGTGAVNFEIRNQCTYTVWAASLNPGGGKALESGQSWTLSVAAGQKAGRIWGRTSCSFGPDGKGSCKTGDCGGLLNCQGSGAVPATLVEYTLNAIDGNKDIYDISLVDGFNLPLSVTPTNGQCTNIACNSDINNSCPAQLKVDEGCKSSCAALPSDQNCCTGAFLNSCPPNEYAKFFKGKCPQAYSYAKDDPSSTFNCSSGTDYKIVFCP
eukprot:Gb_19743 [translate_table: standard]